MSLVRFPAATTRTLEKFAELTGANSVAELVRDALRTYRWILRQQAKGLTVVGLARKDMEFLSQAEGLSGKRPYLVPFFLLEKKEEFEALFAQEEGESIHALPPKEQSKASP